MQNLHHKEEVSKLTRDSTNTVQRSLRVRTLELLWHCKESNEESEQLGMQSTSLVEGITSIDYNSFRNRIVTTGGDQCIRLWQLDNSAIEAWLFSNTYNMSQCSKHICKMQSAWMPLSVRWSPLCTLIASSHCEGKICLWWNCSEGSERAANGERANKADFEAGEEWKDYRHLVGHVNDVYDLAFSPDSRFLLSGAGDGSIIIHDLEGGTMPVVQLANQHNRFCCGVAWDPWNRYLHSFGASPALQFYINVAPQQEGHRIHLAPQRRCQGDFLGEPDVLSFRRMSWSPDGLFLAVPYGKNSQRAGLSTASLRDVGTTTLAHSFGPIQKCKNPGVGKNISSSVVEASFADRKGLHKAEVVNDEGMNCTRTNRNRYTVGDTRENSCGGGKKCFRMKGSTKINDDEENDMVHCVNIYLRNALDKLAARLVIRGYNEIRGVQWAQCFLEPLPVEEPLPLVLNHSSGANEVDTTAAAGIVQGASTAQREDATDAYGAWGPADYRMVLALWTSDAVVVYTTDSCTRHSDFTDLHLRSITDVAWSANARFLYTASLDGYVSVISFGTSLTLAHSLPTFSTRPVTVALTKMLMRVREGSKTSRGHKTLAEHADKNSTTVATVRKKKRAEAGEAILDVPTAVAGPG